jgi:hypothetical protein
MVTLMFVGTAFVFGGSVGLVAYKIEKRYEK